MTTGAFDHEYYPERLDDTRAYDGVRRRRVLAFLLDCAIVGVLWLPAALLVGLFGLVTFGFGWLLYGILFPALALLYVSVTMGGPAQATIGMRITGIRLDRFDGRPVDGLFAILHSVLFWALNVLLSPLILLASLVLDRKRTVHDLLLGTVVTRSDV
jgi:uncharacterized RDD family membrane protein YckC